jgi:hypothetical protein
MAKIKITVIYKKDRRKEECLGEFELEEAAALLESFNVLTYIPEAKEGDCVSLWFQAGPDREITVAAFANQEFGVLFNVQESKKLLGMISVSKKAEWTNAWPLTRAEAVFMVRFILGSDPKDLARWVQNNLLLMRSSVQD